MSFPLTSQDRENKMSELSCGTKYVHFRITNPSELDGHLGTQSAICDRSLEISELCRTICFTLKDVTWLKNEIRLSLVQEVF